MSKAVTEKFKWEVLDAVLQFKPSLIMCEEILGISHDTIERAIKKNFNMTFSEYREYRMSKTKFKLAQKQFDVAMNGNVTMLIWLGKQYLGQSDKIEQTTEIAINPTEIQITAKRD
jgi:hypothetical protein